jgi:hypothetical protein
LLSTLWNKHIIVLIYIIMADCWKNCPRINAELTFASEVTQYMPPGSHDQDVVWRRTTDYIETLSRDCPEPTLLSINTIETRLPFHNLRNLLGMQAVKHSEVEVYDCTVKPLEIKPI